MDGRRQAKDSSFSYSTLFNLESLVNFKVPQPEDDFDYYGNSSQDESRGAAMANYSNGTISERELGSMKRRRSNNINEEEEEEAYNGTQITEERYRTMLGEHIQKYKRRLKDSSSSPALPRTGMSVQKSNLGGSKKKKLGSDQRGGLYEMETTSDWLGDVSPKKPAAYNETHFTPKYGFDSFA